jgi:hypothetical protein
VPGTLINPAISRFVPGGIFEVIKQLPGGNEPEYRIKSANEPHERVARESALADEVIGSKRKVIAIINRNHVLIRLPPSPPVVEFSEATAIRWNRRH